MEFVHTALSVDINQNGVVIKIRHPAFLQIRNKLRQLEKRRRRKRIRKRKKLRRWTCLNKTLGE